MRQPGTRQNPRLEQIRNWTGRCCKFSKHLLFVSTFLWFKAQGLMLMMDMMVYMSDSQCNQILDSMSLGLMIRSFSACDAVMLGPLSLLRPRFSATQREHGQPEQEPLRFSSSLKARPRHWPDLTSGLEIFFTFSEQIGSRHNIKSLEVEYWL